MLNESKNIISIKKVNLLGLLLLYVFSASLTMVDKLTFLDETTHQVINTIDEAHIYAPVYDLGVDYKNGSTNTFFLGTVAFWFNLFLFSALPFVLCVYIFKIWYITIATSSLPLYWGFLFFRSIENASAIGDLIMPNLDTFIYSFVFFGTGILTLELFRLRKSAKAEKKIAELEEKILSIDLNGRSISPTLYFKIVDNLIKASSMHDIEERNKYAKKALDSFNEIMKGLEE